MSADDEDDKTRIVGRGKPPPTADQTVIVPTPRRKSASTTNPAPRRRQRSTPNAAATPTVAGSYSNSGDITGKVNLSSCGEVLLSLTATLRRMSDCGDVNALREQLSEQIHEFERRATRAEIPRQQIVNCHYALCVALDDAILNTPWGARQWQQDSLLHRFHNNQSRDKGLLSLISKALQDPGNMIDELEFYFVIVNNGYQGPYRGSANAADDLQQLRNSLYTALHSNQNDLSADFRFSDDWQAAVSKRKRILSRIPVWVVAVLVGAVLTASYSGFQYWMYTTTQTTVNAIEVHSQSLEKTSS